MRRLLTLLVAALTLVPLEAHAQGVAHTLDELRLLVRVGDTLTITDDAGQQVRGRLTDLSPASLVLTVGRERREWTGAQVTSISQQHGDSLRNGALIGLAAGGGLVGAALVFSDRADGTISVGEAALAATIYAGLGAAIGTGIDALIPGQRVVLERRPGGAGPTLAFGPVLAPRRVGVRLSLGF